MEEDFQDARKEYTKNVYKKNQGGKILVPRGLALVLMYKYNPIWQVTVKLVKKKVSDLLSRITWKITKQ